MQKESDGEMLVTVAPITHLAPTDPGIAVEIPAKVKAHLGLDGERSWIVLSEVNRFAWPGSDLRPLPGKKGTWSYGFLPPALFGRIRDRLRVLKASTIVRDPQGPVGRRR